MTDSPPISVIVCAHNEEKLLGACLESLLRQTLDPVMYEVVVVDDESTDRTPEIARSAAAAGTRVRVRYRRIQRGGLSVARTTGIAESAGHVLAFIDGDALAEPDWLERLVSPILDGSADIAAGTVENLRDASATSRLLHVAHYRSSVAAADLKLTGANMAFHRRVFDATGGFFSFFDRRGDETSVAEAYLSQPGKRRRARFVADAVVLHHHPDRVRDWWRIQRYEGGMHYVVEAAIVTGLAAANAKAAIRLVALLSPLAAAGSVAAGAPIPAAIAGAPFLLRLAARSPRFGSAVWAVLRERGPGWALWALPVLVVGLLVRDAGYVENAFRLGFGRRVPELRARRGKVAAALDSVLDTGGAP